MMMIKKFEANNAHLMPKLKDEIIVIRLHMYHMDDCGLII